MEGIVNNEVVFKKVLDCSFKVHTALGPGLLESSYEECLCFELNNAGLLTEKQKPLSLVYHEVNLDIGYRVDILVEKTVIIEIKSLDTFNEVHFAQIFTYLKLSACKLGLLINFNVSHLKDGIKRVVL